ncbi:HAD family hydrolase [Butyricicoccus sp. Marseille-Q5471]|uniref:HAD family hydrolase n=1 Tax=Butyricicoccus sp. Marseille-Q5471 TaxID=3039493 RepID=UPI0024BC5D27|nr:HAD family hydrolase [Butyricicoccus sp. Marseille-Q5471]
MSFRACIWDLDGTLFYTLPTIHYYCNRSLAHFGLREITVEECQDLCRLSITQFYQRLLELGGCPSEDMNHLAPRIRDFDCASYLADFTYLTKPYDGIRETLTELKQMGVKNAVLTNKPNQIACSLVNLFFSDLIDVCIGQTPESISKPDPRSLDAVLHTLSISRSEAVYVGDTDVDMQTAHNTGVAAAAVAWGYQPLETLLCYKPDFVVHTPHELISLF